MKLQEFISKKITINIITTGGTIEKSYDESDGSLSNRASIIRAKLISKLRLPYTDLNFHPLLAKDSLYMDDNDRQILLEFINTLAVLHHPILVLHGTDTMEISAQFCFERIGNPKVPIIFTGAMRPLGFDDTDALQNVTESLILTRVLQPGIYVSFHGNIFPLPMVRKNRALGTFEKYEYEK